MEDIAKNEIPVYDFAALSEELDDHIVHPEQLPFALMGATFPHDGSKRGRKYPWGFIDVDDAKVCDLRSLETILLKYPSHVDFN
ncbi:Septin domain-containing protein [Paramicrosporidium saccamoebae]|uniref:Septin domain-containing protein n=1 Tax=Paramicrosporidium saccamoebae TaxID=1246581 RepID=A0A2H9TM47_9FUNG|nr:Septin domain-containing protein [Paramicrosporidium saccamoebae]